MQALQIRVDDVEQYGRMNTLEIHGIPESAGAKVVNTIMQVGKALSVDIEKIGMFLELSLSLLEVKEFLKQIVRSASGLSTEILGCYMNHLNTSTYLFQRLEELYEQRLVR